MNENEADDAENQKNKKGKGKKPPKGFLRKFLDEFKDVVNEILEDETDKVEPVKKQKDDKNKSKKSTGKSKGKQSSNKKSNKKPKSDKPVKTDQDENLFTYSAADMAEFSKDYGNVIAIQNKMDVEHPRNPDGTLDTVVVNIGIQITDVDIMKMIDGISQHKWLYQRCGENHFFLWPVTLFGKNVDGEEYVDDGASIGVYVWERTVKNDDYLAGAFKLDDGFNNSENKQVISNFILRTFDCSYDGFVDISTETTNLKYKKYNVLYENLLEILTAKLFLNYTGAILTDPEDGTDYDDFGGKF